MSHIIIIGSNKEITESDLSFVKESLSLPDAEIKVIESKHNDDDIKSVFDLLTTSNKLKVSRRHAFVSDALLLTFDGGFYVTRFKNGASGTFISEGPLGDKIKSLTNK